MVFILKVREDSEAPFQIKSEWFKFSGNLNLASALGMCVAEVPRPQEAPTGPSRASRCPAASSWLLPPISPEAEFINFIQERKTSRVSWQIMSLFQQKSLRLFMLLSFVLDHISIRMKLCCT